MIPVTEWLDQILVKNLGTELAGKTPHFVNTLFGPESLAENLGTEPASKKQHFVNTRKPDKESGHRTCKQETTLY